MFRDTDWDALEEALRECAPQVTDSDCAYLKDAFARTERMWSENFARVSRVRLVMLSEAPLFGAEASYIYNPLTRPTVFFRISDAEAILDPEFPRDRSDKQLPLPELAQAGFVILDVFPFALNELDTPSITYRCKSGRPCRKLSDKNYQHLFESTAPLYFDRLCFGASFLRLNSGSAPNSSTKRAMHWYSAFATFPMTRRSADVSLPGKQRKWRSATYSFFASAE